MVNFDTLNMKRIFKLLVPCIFCAVFMACEPRHINDNLYDSEVYIINGGYIETDMFYDAEGQFSLPVYVYCGGYYGGNPTVSLEASQGALDAWNGSNPDNQLKMLPEDCYSIDPSQKEMQDERATFNITFNCDALGNLSQEDDYSDLDVYCLPLELNSLSEDIKVTEKEGMNTVIIVPEMSLWGCTLENAGVSDLSLADMKDDGENIVVEYTVRTVVENEWEGAVKFAFNTESEHAAYELLPEGSYTVSGTEGKFVPGVSEVTFTVKIDKSAMTASAYSIVAKIEYAGGFKIIGDDYSVINLLNRKFYDKSEITVESCNSYSDDGWNPEVTFDGNLDNFWEAGYSGHAHGTTKPPFEIIYDLGKEVSVCGVELYFRNYRYSPGDKNYTFTNDTKAGHWEISSDLSEWTRVYDYDFGTASREPGPYYHEWPAAEGRYLKFTVTESNRSNAANLAEINIMYR